MSLIFDVPGVEGVVKSILGEIEMISGNVFVAEAIKNATPPFVFYSSQTDDEDYALDGCTGLHTAAFAVHCVSVSYAQLVALCGLVRSALHNLQGETLNGIVFEHITVRQASPDIKEKEVNFYRRMYTLQINYQEV